MTDTASAPTPPVSREAPAGAGVQDQPESRRKRRITGRPAIFLLASIIVALLASSSAPTPLYAIYQSHWGFSPITTTIIFGVYAVAVLVSLLTLGKLSDYLGRRPVLLVAIAVQVVALIVFITAGNVPELLIARVVQGVSTGAALGAIGAGMLDVDRERGAFANSFAPMLGTSLGAIVSAVLVRYLPLPTSLTYIVLLAVFVLQAIGVVVVKETVTRKRGALGSLVPEIKLPRALRGAILTSTPVLFAVWSLASLYGGLGPALVRNLTHSSAVIPGSLALTILAGCAVVTPIVLRRVDGRKAMLIGIPGLIIGVGITLIAIDTRSIVLFFIGTAISGLGFGGGFQGGIRTVVAKAAPHERSGVMSLLYTVSYLGLGVPAVIAGFLIVDVGGLVNTTYEYGGALILIALAALASLLRSRPASAATPSAPAPAGYDK